MNPLLKAGTAIVILALASYSLAILTEQRRRVISGFVLTFLTLGVALDITATTFMILGSSNTPFSVHGLLGYTSLAGMHSRPRLASCRTSGLGSPRAPARLRPNVSSPGARTHLCGITASGSRTSTTC